MEKESSTRPKASAQTPETGILKDFYAVNPPFGNVAIKYERGAPLYTVVEPTITEQERISLGRLKEYLLEEVNPPHEVLHEDHESKKMEEFLSSQAQRVIKDYKLKVSKDAFEKIMYYIKRDFLGYGKIDVMIRDPNIEDVSCDGVSIPIYVWHRSYESIPSSIVYDSREELDALVSRLAYKSGGQITVSKPIHEGTLPGGYRIHLTLDEVSKRGATFTIRKFLAEPLTMIDLIILGALSPKIASYFWILVENLRSMLVVGPTAAGKTTTLGSISMFIRPEMKVITIEELREIRLPHENWIPMVARSSFQDGASAVSLFDLLKSSLRQRPDYIIVGEVRAEEAYTLFQAISIGHGGLATMHAENVDSAMKRLLTRPMEIPPVLIPLMNVVALMGRVKIRDKITRRMLSVKEVTGFEGSAPTLHNIFDWSGEVKDTFEFSGESFVFNKISEMRHIPVETLYRELDNRETILCWMAQKKIRRYLEVAEVIRRYYASPQEVLHVARTGGDWTFGQE